MATYTGQQVRWTLDDPAAADHGRVVAAPRRRLPVVLSGLFAAGALALLLWVVTPAAPDEPGHRRSPPPEVRMKEWSARVKALTYIPIEDRELFRRTIAEAISDPKGVASPAALDRLVVKLEAMAHAWSAPDSSEYLAFADAEPTTWITPDDDRAWEFILESYAQIATTPLRRDRPREVLRELMDAMLGTYRCRLTGLAPKPDGALIRVRRARHIDELIPGSMAMESTEALQWWYGGGAAAVKMFRNPKFTAREVIRRDGSVLYAEVHLRFMTERELPWKWEAIMYYDPALGAWQMHSFSNRGKAGMFLFY